MIRIHKTIPILILVAAAVFRLAFVEDARLAGDEAVQYATAKHVAELKLFPVTGVNMTGDAAMTPGGMYHLIMAIPYFFSSQPEAAGVFLIILNILGLGLGYVLFKREFGAAAALAALILAAFNPFSVFFSDRQWNPNLLVPLGFVWVWLLLGAFRGEGRFRWGWLVALLIVSPQIHMSCPHLTLMTLVLLAAWRPKVRWGHVAAGIGIGFATYLPYFIVDGMNGWKNTLRIAGQLAEAKAPWFEAFRAGYYQILYAGGDFTYFLGKGFWFPMTEWGFFGKGGATQYAALAGLPSWTGYVSVAAIVIALLIAVGTHGFTFVDTAKKWFSTFTATVRREPLQALVVLNIPVLILLMLKTGKAFYPHYSMVLFPLAMVPVAVAVSRIKRPAIVGVVLAVTLLIAVNQAVLTARYYRTEESKGSVFVMKEASRTILEDAGPSSFRVVIEMPTTRLGTYPMSVMAREVHNAPWRESRDSKLTYVLTQAGSIHERSAVKMWDIDGRRLIRKESPAR
jgi:hypothetical protein